MDPERTLTAAELDSMTPDERQAEFRRRVVTDPAVLSEELRAKIRDTAERLGNERRQIG